MAIEHILQDSDTLQGLAVHYGIPSWQDIADFNNLDFPYTAPDQLAVDELRASGWLTIVRDFYQSDLQVLKGSTLSTKTDAQGIQKTYEVTEDTTLPAGSATGYLFVRCVSLGAFGNTVEGSVTELTKVNTSTGTNVGIASVTNEAPFTNGRNARILVTGQTIYIPSQDDTTQTVNRDASDLLAFGGEDIEVTSEGDMVFDGHGDLGSVAGTDNIVQAVVNRFTTEKGDLTQHLDYGIDTGSVIGRTHTPYAEKLVELALYQAIASEDRVDEITLNSVNIVGTSVEADVTLHIGLERRNVTINL